MHSKIRVFVRMLDVVSTTCVSKSVYANYGAALTKQKVYHVATDKSGTACHNNTFIRIHARAVGYYGL